MFEDIVICEIKHIDPDNNEYCTPQEISIGNSRDDGILLSMLFENADQPKLDTQISRPTQLEISAEVLNHETDSNFIQKYDVQTGVILKIKNEHEVCDILVGSNGENFHYFTNTPSFNNTTDYGDTIFINFPHCVEGFTFNDKGVRLFK